MHCKQMHQPSANRSSCAERIFVVAERLQESEHNKWSKCETAHSKLSLISWTSSRTLVPYQKAEFDSVHQSQPEINFHAEANLWDLWKGSVLHLRGGWLAEHRRLWRRSFHAATAKASVWIFQSVWNCWQRALLLSMDAFFSVFSARPQTNSTELSGKKEMLSWGTLACTWIRYSTDNNQVGSLFMWQL